MTGLKLITGNAISGKISAFIHSMYRAAPNIILPLPDTCPLPPLTYPVPVPIVPVYPAPPIFPPYPPPPVFPPYPPPPSYR